MKTQFGELVTGDFEDNTLTIEIDGEMEIQAGRYAVVPIDEYNRLVKKCDLADVGGSLPSDEDIQKEAYIRVECWDKVNDGDEVDGGYDGFIKGCKWIIGKLRQ